MCFVEGFDCVMTLILAKILGLFNENKANKPRESPVSGSRLVLKVRRIQVNMASPSVEGSAANSSLCGVIQVTPSRSVWPRLEHRTPALPPTKTTRDEILFLCK